ncbi:glutathione S-transferase C-terminal domain-containing protein [Sansalvadorimonas sp. 2012CJ34-2]|uniref:Glutathione S-transferase C-terminal domain-containing protein n=1 Tax=Parendozoicomonas callyspongiae TaxID=2942213 RepID=A0ABT0PKF0_9GAMM|nr:glutathione S-transferase C-terminal domain-containing protein [Sansalvadorimonas sp. 2012CJ34-2]MCL6271872.1 glutathione S-transferase C-terminal domain-containing protein [Sansalvadorimonas sp. 2012CJ34-2]
MKLYISSVTPVSVMIRLVMAAKQLDQEIINLSAGRDEVPSRVKELPSLVTDDLCLAQPLAILEYLEECYSDMALYPADIAQRAAVRSFVHVIARDLLHWEHSLSSRYMEQELGMDKASQRDWLMLCLKEGFSHLEHLLATQARTGTYCFGEQVTVADLALLPQVLFARKAGLSMHTYPHIERICDNCLELEWCQRILGDS